jgi:hypothetical protein
MDRLGELLNLIREQGTARDNLIGLFNILIGRRISLADGTLVSSGLTWRELATLFKRVRWDREAVRQLGLDPDALPPRDRQRFWYAAIAHAGVDSPAAAAAGERLARQLQAAGYQVGPAPGAKS